MEIFLAVLILITSFVLIIIGGNKFVDSSVAIAKKLKIPVAIIGATLVAIGTTTPELLVTIFSASSEASGLAVGNALGSIIFNTCVIGGVLLVCTVLTIKKDIFWSYSILFFAILATTIMGVDKIISLSETILLLIVFAGFIVINYFSAKKMPETVNVQNVEKEKPIWILLLIFIASAATIGAGAYFMVEKAKFLAKLANISDTIIGLTIVSFGTSLPELITSITAIKKKEAGLGLGNIIGSNIINCTLLIGITGIFNSKTGLTISSETLFITLPVAIFATILMLLPTIIKKRTYKWQGICLMTLYTAYYIYLFSSAFNIIKI